MTVKEYTEQKLKELKKFDAKNHVVQDKEKQSSEEKELVKQFYNAIKSKDFRKMEEVNALILKDYKEKAQTVGTIGSGTAGGILVPTSVSDSIIAKMNYISPMRQIATVISNMPPQLQLPSENSMVQAYWVAEGNAPTESGEIFDPNLLTPYKAAALDSFTSEVIADAATNPSIQAFVESRFAIALALLENAAFVNGDGSGKPYGFRSSAITPNSIAQQGDTIGYTDVTNLKYSLKTGYRASAVFVTSSVGMQGLENVRDNYGRPIFRQGLTEATPDKLLNRPIYLVDEIPQNLGTGSSQTELWFGNFANYFIGDRGPLRVDYGTNASDFANDKISLRVLKRVAGRPVIGESFTKLTGVQ
jgi:HK97 family phage major capsid protein